MLINGLEPGPVSACRSFAPLGLEARQLRAANANYLKTNPAAESSEFAANLLGLTRLPWVLRRRYPTPGHEI
eukprot:3211642-Alexandrium_andersonii.AAC.1